jgi:hypothetical protein
MQAYQTAPCPYCGATWNPPGAQSCTNCRNQLPPTPPAYAPPGYSPEQGQSPQSPYGQPGYPQQPGYAQAPSAYPGAPAGYPGQSPAGYPGQGQQPYQQPGQPGYPAQPGQYPNYAGYVPPSAYGAPYPGAPGYAPGAPSSGAKSTTLHLFGQSFAVPVAIPPVVVQYQQQIAYAAIGIVALLIVFFGVLPAIASGQVTSAEAAITTATGQQSTVDAGFAAVFAPDSSSSDLVASKAYASKQLEAVNNALGMVRADEQALSSSDQTLSMLEIVALPSHQSIAAERQRITTALNGLRQADTALTAASNQGKVSLPFFDAMIDFAKMYAALGKRDLVGAAAPYPDADQKLQEAINADQLPGVPAGTAKQLSAFKSLLDNSENLIQAIQNKDAAGVKKYSDAVQSGLKTIQSLANAVPNDYWVKTFSSNQKAYDTAMKGLKG